MTDEMLVRAAIRDELSGPLENIREELRGVARDTDAASKRANIGARSFDRMASGAGRFVKAGLGMAARAAAAGLAAVSAAAVVGGAKVLSMASDAAETASAFRTVFKGVAGDVSGYVDRLNKRFGITTAELDAIGAEVLAERRDAGPARGLGAAVAADCRGERPEIGGARVAADAASAREGIRERDLRRAVAAARGAAEPSRSHGRVRPNASPLRIYDAEHGLGDGGAVLGKALKAALRRTVVARAVGGHGVFEPRRSPVGPRERRRGEREQQRGYNRNLHSSGAVANG